MDDLTGQTIGGCRILRVLGKGGIGAVFRAEHLASRKAVALKILHREMADKPDVVERFSREARLCFQIEHPGIVRVFTWGEDAGWHYMAMEYVRGTALDRLIKHHRRLAWPMVASIVADVAEGLDHAHTLDIVHRDIKPSNMLVARGGRGKLSDLGLARQLEGGLDLKGRRITLKGAVIGSPAYMAPEQIRDTASVGIGADIYGLGASLYHALSGRPPLTGETASDTLVKVLREVPPSLSDFDERVPKSLSVIVDACLAKEPADRPATAGDLARLLRDLLRHRGYVMDKAAP